MRGVGVACEDGPRRAAPRVRVNAYRSAGLRDAQTRDKAAREGGACVRAAERMLRPRAAARPIRWTKAGCGKCARRDAARRRAAHRELSYGSPVRDAGRAATVSLHLLHAATPLMNTTPDLPTPRALRELTPLEARILGVLVEKQHTVPDTYPLSLNALTAGCNQKTARAPVMNVSDDEVTTALDGLKHLSLVMEGSSSRVPRFEHNVNRVLGIPSQAIALLTILLLRGPQTAAELRLNSARLHGFADISSVEAFLDELAARAQPLVVRLPRAPGARENRWMHLMCGEVNVADYAGSDTGGGADSVPPSEFEALKAEQKRLTDEVARLHALVQRMATELGIDVDGPGDAG